MTESRIEWAVRTTWPDGYETVPEFDGRNAEKRARYMANYWNTRSDGPTCAILSRTVTVTVGPWTEAPNGGEA